MPPRNMTRAIWARFYREHRLAFRFGEPLPWRTEHSDRRDKAIRRLRLAGVWRRQGKADGALRWLNGATWARIWSVNP